MLISKLLPAVIIFLGIFLLIKLRFFFILHPGRVLKCLKEGGVGKENISSFILALAGTLGVGNIVGVAAGIAAGGPGTVIWLIFSASLSGVIKYAEVALVTDKNTENGMIGIIKCTFPHTGRGLSLIYAILCLCLCFVMGNALQTKAIAESLDATLGIKPVFLAMPLLLILIPITLYGKVGIKKAVGIIIPAATVIYIALCLLVIIPNLYKLPSVIREIFSCAFSPRSAIGGIFGILFSRPVTEGFARGMLSNEAGAGTSSLAHSTSKKSSAAVGGILGGAEVLFDTVLLCTLTAFTILLGKDEIFNGFGDLCDIFTLYAGELSGTIIFLLTSAFALSTVLCWFYYGKVCAGEILGRPPKYFYFPTFIAVSVIGLFLPSTLYIDLCDFLLFLMTLIVSAVLIKSCDRIKILSQQANLLFKNSDKGDWGSSKF